MKGVVLLALVLAVPAAALAVTPAQEKAFVDTYRNAYESKDAKTLDSLLYTRGADPRVTALYRKMMNDGLGSKLDAIALEPLSDEDKAYVAKALPGPGGKPLHMTLVPVRKLVFKRTTTSASGSSSSTSRVFVAETGGRLVIPVPGPRK